MPGLHEGHEGKEHEQSSGLLGPQGSSLAASDVEDNEDHEEGGAANSVVEPLGTVTGIVTRVSDGRKETSHNHEDVGENDQDGLGRGKTGENGEGDQEQRSSEEPVDVTWCMSEKVDGYAKAM
jgi:hypothetical protein